MGSSKTTTESKTAPLSEEGLEYQSMFNSVILQQMDLAGYEPKTQEKTQYQDPTKASNLKNQIDTIDKQIADLQASLAKDPAKSGLQPIKNGEPVAVKDPREKQIEALQNQRNKAQNDLNKIPQTTYTDYTFEKKPDPRLQNAIDNYGADSPEAKAIQNQIKQEEVYTAEAKANITKTYLEKAQKLVNGDYSFTPEQKAVTDTYFAPIKDTLINTTDMLLADADKNQDNLFDYVNKYADQIDKTGIDVKDALDAALIQVEKSNKTLLQVVDDVNSKYEAKAKFEFDLLSQQADQKAAAQASLLGLPPGSMVEKKQAAAMKYNALQSVLLDMEANTANQKLGIATQTEGEKKAISLANVDLAQSQGAKKENLAGTALNIAAQTGATKMGIKGAYAQNLLGLEQDKMNLLYNSAVGSLPQSISGGQGVLGFQQGLQSGQMNQVATASAPIQYGLGIEEQRTFNEAKTTQKTTPSIGSTIMGAVGGLASAAGGVMSGIGAMSPAPTLNIFGGGK